MSVIVRRTVWVTLLSGAVGLAMLPMAQTQWAEDTRASASRGHGEGAGEGEAPPRAMMLVLPFVKVGVLMGVPALVVLGAGAAVRRLRR
ncbi:MAG: hypothetical protein AAGA54_16400 [Myxococcota bacterium]